LYTNI